MLERFTREKQLRRKSAVFDLEDDDGPEDLTHMGQSLSLNGPALKDDFEEDDLELSDAEDHPSDEERQARKRRRQDVDGEFAGEEDEENFPERKKSKQEVMKEVIAKSKLFKYERQAMKDDDDDTREALDKELPNIHELLHGIAKRPAPAPVIESAGMNPDRAALLNGVGGLQLNKDYDKSVRQLALDKRSQPTEKSKPEAQIVEERARKLQELEAKRIRRMHGEQVSDDEPDEKDEPPVEGFDDEEEDFGLGAGIKTRPVIAELGVEDEDDFLIDDDLIASGSEVDESEDESSAHGEEPSENGDDEFLKGLLTEEEAKRPEFLTGANAPLPEIEEPAFNGINGDLAYQFDCPQSHEELLETTKSINILDLPTVIQRIRALYHPKLKSENKAKLGNFTVALIDHVSYLANQDQQPPFSVLETTIRHIHSLSKTYPVEVANAFRRHLRDIDSSRSLTPTPGDLVLLTAIGSIFPTSDHFHQVVTPAILSMGRYLGLKIPQTLSDYATGAYLCTLCMQYQKLSKRYVPEMINFIENTLSVLAPSKLTRSPGNFPHHEPKVSVRINTPPEETRRLTFYDCIPRDLSDHEEAQFKIALLETDMSLLELAANTWTGKEAFYEVFEPCLKLVEHLSNKKCSSKLPANTRVSLSLSIMITSS